MWDQFHKWVNIDLLQKLGNKKNINKKQKLASYINS